MPSLIRRIVNAVTGNAAPPEGEATGTQTLIVPNFGGIAGGAVAGIPPALIGGMVGIIDPLCGTYQEWLGNDPYAFGHKWLRPWYWGTYNTYRLIYAHPRCQQAFATLINPILAGTWDFEAVDESCPEDLVDLVRQQLNPLRRKYVEHAAQAVNLGWQPFEPVWEMKNGKHCLTKLKPLLHDITTIKTDTAGNITELINGTYNVDGQGNPLTVAQNKALIYSFRPQCGYWYGFPLTESIRLVAWRMWLSAAFQLHGIGEKLSNVIAMGFAPAGSYTDPKTNQTITPTQEMATALAGLKNSGMAVFTNLVAMAKPGATAADLAKASAAAMSSIQFYDAGNHSAAIGGELEVMAAAEDLFFAGYLLSSRTGMQSKNGSRADSEQHSDTGLVSSQLIGDDIADQLQPMVDAILVLNGGEKWRGAVRIKQSPLVDDTKGLYGDLMKAALADQTVGPELYGTLDWEAIARRLDVAVKEGAKVNDAVKAAVETRREQQAKAATIPQPGTRTDGKPEGGNPPPDAEDDEDKVLSLLSRFTGDGGGDSSRVKYLSASDPEGEWRTINGVHVLIKDGVITKGPSHLVGKNPEHIAGAKISEPKDKYDIRDALNKELRSKHGIGYFDEVNTAANDRWYGEYHDEKNNPQYAYVDTPEEAFNFVKNGLQGVKDRISAKERKIVSDIFGREVDNSEYKRIFSVDDKSEIVAKINDSDDSVSVEIKSPTHGGLHMKRKFAVDNRGPYVVNELFTLGETGTGAGTNILASQIDNLRKMGIGRMKTLAARGDRFNGYYTWARLGYDGPIPASVKKAMPAELAGATTIQELMLTPGGQKFWKENGASFNGTFKITPGRSSPGERVFDAYVTARAGRSTA